MFNTFKYTVISLIKEKTVLIWAFLFPLIMATLFTVMFAGLDEAFEFEPIPVGIVDNTAYQETEAFSLTIERLTEKGEDQLLVAHYVTEEDEANELLKAGDIEGYYAVDNEGTPVFFATGSQRLDNLEVINQTILKDILNNYLRSSATIETLLETNPAVLADPAVTESLFKPESYTEEISVIANTASTTVRYFYALLGFAAIMGANIAMIGITRTQANLSPLGARRALGATSRTRTLAGTFLACWLLSFACLFFAFCYMRFVLGVNFGGRDLMCVFGLIVASFMTTSLGTFVGSLPKLGEGVKNGILTGLSCGLALFTGLYGDSSQKLADELTRNAPFFQMMNPAKQVTDLFYSLYFYDTYEHFFTAVFILIIMTALFLLCSMLFMRRQRYASL